MLCRVVPVPCHAVLCVVLSVVWCGCSAVSCVMCYHFAGKPNLLMFSGTLDMECSCVLFFASRFLLHVHPSPSWSSLLPPTASKFVLVPRVSRLFPAVFGNQSPTCFLVSLCRCSLHLYSLPVASSYHLSQELEAIPRGACVMVVRSTIMTRDVFKFETVVGHHLLTQTAVTSMQSGSIVIWSKIQL